MAKQVHSGASPTASAPTGILFVGREMAVVSRPPAPSPRRVPCDSKGYTHTHTHTPPQRARVPSWRPMLPGYKKHKKFWWVEAKVRVKDPITKLGGLPANL